MTTHAIDIRRLLYYLLCTISLLLAFSRIVFSETHVSSHPVIYCKEPTFYFGEVDNTEMVVHTFVIENKGDSPLTITRVKAGCGCTTTNLNKKTILPGETTGLTARLSLRKRSGNQKKSITVYSNDPASPRYRLYLEGIAKPLIDISPPALKFSSLATGQSLTKIITLTCNSDTPFHILSVSLDSSLFACVQETVQENKAYLFKVTAKPLETPGISRSHLLVNTDHPKFPQITIPLTVQVVADVVVAPTEIVLHTTRGTPASVKRYIAVQSPKRLHFKILSVKPPTDNIKVSIQQLDVGMYRN